MLDLYFARTPNGMKLKLIMEELDDLGVAPPHRWHLVRLSAGEQHTPEFLAISPNNKIPAIVDHAPADHAPVDHAPVDHAPADHAPAGHAPAGHAPDGGGAPLSIFESGAILQYLAEKTGHLLSREPHAKWETLQWLTWQVAGLGPMAGQSGWFRTHATQEDLYAMERYTRETQRLYGVLDRRVEGRAFIAGEYSIADIACWPWVVSHAGHGIALDDFPNVKRWFEAIRQRPATQRAFADYNDPYAHPKFDLRREEATA